MSLSGIHDFDQLNWIPDQKRFGNDNFSVHRKISVNQEDLWVPDCHLKRRCCQIQAYNGQGEKGRWLSITRLPLIVSSIRSFPASQSLYLATFLKSHFGGIYSILNFKIKKYKQEKRGVSSPDCLTI